MSFSADVKNELILRSDSSMHCRIAELAGALSVNGRFADDKDGDKYLSVRADNPALAEKLSRLLYNVMERRFNFDPSYVEAKHGFRIIISDEAILKELCEKLKLYNADVYVESGNLVTERTCCKKAYLRGAFLTGGSVSSPEKAYQLEIACTTEKNADKLSEILMSLHLESKRIKRKSRFIVYIKDGDTISDFLGMTGGMNSLMEFENIRVLKEMRNSINREVNCDTANINKVVNAATKQIDDIKLIEERRGLDSLPEQLKTVAEIRLANPHLSLAELGERLSPPLGKSGVNHRLAKISKIADSMR